MRTKSLFLLVCLFTSITFLNVSAAALEKPTVQSFTLSKIDIDITDPNFTIDFEVLITHPKGIEDVSTLLTFTNSQSVNISVPLVRTDSPADFSKKEVVFKGKLTLPRTLNAGVYTYSIDGVKNNFDSGTRFPTGIVNGPTLRNLKGAESGIIIRSNGELNLDYETINGPAFGSQSGLTYLDTKKYTSVTAPIWRVGETLNLIDYFEVTVPEVELKALTFTPNICTSNGKIINFISEGECQYKVFTPKTKNYIEKSKLLAATITNARSQQNLTVENIPEKVGENKLTSIYIIISVISFFLFGVVVKKIYYCYLKIKQHMNDRKREFEKLKKVEQQHTFDQQTNGQQHKSDHELLPILDKEIFDGYKLKKTDSHMTQIEDEIILFSINDRNLK